MATTLIGVVLRHLGKLATAALLTAGAIAAIAQDSPLVFQSRISATDAHGDPLPPGALARLGTTRFRQSFSISCAAFSPDGKTVAVGGAGRTLCLWDVTTGRELRDFRIPKQAYAVAFSPDGKVLASCMDRRAVLFDVGTGKALRELTSGSYSLAFSPDGKILATAGEADGMIRLWNVDTGKEQHRLQGHKGQVHSAAFAPDGKTLASAGDDKTIRLWDPVTGNELRQLSGHQKEVRCIAFSPNGTTLASGSYDRTVRLWDLAMGKELRALENGEGGVRSVAISPDGRTLACDNGDGMIRLWDPATGKEHRRWQAHTIMVPSLAFSPDGKMLLSAAYWESCPRLWEVATGKELLAFSGHRTAVDVLAFSADGKVLFSGGRDKQVLQWDLARGRETRHFRWRSSASAYDRLALSPDGKTAATLEQADRDGALRLWDVLTGKELHSLGPFGNPTATFSPSLLAFSPDGKLFAAAGRQNTVHLWDVANGKKLRRFGGVPGPISSVAFTPDGNRLAAAWGGPNSGVAIAEVDRGFVVWIKHTGPVNGPMDIVFSPDDKQLATSGWEGPVRLWDIATAKELRSFVPDARSPAGRVPGVYRVAFSPDGRFLATAGAEVDTDVHVWEVSTGLEVRRFQGHLTAVCSVAFAPDGRSIASGGADSMIYLWDVTGRMKDGHMQPLDLTERDLEARWKSLASSEAARGVQAVWDLATNPKASVPFLQKKLRRPEPVQKQLKKLIDDLDSDQFDVRSAAAKELERAGEEAEPALRKALAGNLSVEVRQRIEQLLKGLDPEKSPERLRELRAVQALEYAGTPEARQVLEKLTKATPATWLAREAKAALERTRK